MGGMADKAWAAGWNVVRLNQRNCGEHRASVARPLSLRADARSAVRAARTDRTRRHHASCRRRLLAGRQPDAEARRRARRRVAGAQSRLRGLADDGSGGVRESAGAAVEHRLRVQLRAQSESAHAPQGGALPDEFSLEELGRVWTVRQFDEAYTAPHHGFRDATDYYHRASALRVIDRIRVPALILTAEDDPFVPVDPFRDPTVARQSVRDGGRHAARRTLRVRREAQWRVRRLLGGARSREVCEPELRNSQIPTRRVRVERWKLGVVGVGLGLGSLQLASPRSASDFRELRPFPALLVLEIDEDVLTA